MNRSRRRAAPVSRSRRLSPVVVLDRDGTLIVERHYLSHPDQVELIPGVGAALRRLREMGLRLILITNQSAIGRGIFPLARLKEIHHRLIQLLEVEGVQLDGVYYCPHRPEDGCLCRKPLAGLVEQAALDLKFRPQTSFVIGDKWCDVELGRRVGATTFLVRTGYGAQMVQACHETADYVVDDVGAAVPIITGLLAEVHGQPHTRGAAANTAR